VGIGSRFARVALAVGVTLAGLMLLAATAPARTLHTVFQDDALSLFRPAERDQSMRQLRWLGVDELRISADWELEAPAPQSRRAPPGFVAEDPASYDAPGIEALDAAVRSAAGAGLHVIIDPAFSAPLWATANQPAPAATAAEHWYNDQIDVPELVAWEVMLARRYSGTFTPAGASSPLPRVETFTLWNEPNERGYLGPQWAGGRPVSADWYRRLVALAYPAIKAVDPSATVLIGNTSAAGADLEAPVGGVPPLAFIRRLACVDARLRPIETGSCADFRTLPADGYAAHPYERTAPPWQPSGAAHPDWAQMGDLSRIQALLDRLVVLGRLAPGAANLWLTEQGYESNAELSEMPWSEPQQAQLDADSEYLAWRDPQVASFSQFLLRDTRTGETLADRRLTGSPAALLPGTWTTGLEREDGTPKPSLWMFRAPIVARILAPAAVSDAAGSLSPGLPALPPAAPLRVEVWGRARPVRTPTVVQVQGSDGARGAFALLRQTTTDANGIFDLQLTVPASAVTGIRFQWLAPDGRWQSSPSTSPLPVP
jgi:hypothetical protein